MQITLYLAGIFFQFAFVQSLIIFRRRFISTIFDYLKKKILRFSFLRTRPTPSEFCLLFRTGERGEKRERKALEYLKILFLNFGSNES